LREHHDELVECGVPHVALESERNWNFFIEQPGDFCHIMEGWDPTWLSESQAQALHVFILNHCCDKWDCREWLDFFQFRQDPPKPGRYLGRTEDPAA